MDGYTERGAHVVEFPVNDKVVGFSHGVITGREALTQSGNVPASEHQLILVRERRTHLIGTDDEIALEGERGGFLRTFHSDRSFGFTVDEVGQIWGAEEMEVNEFLSIWPPSDGHRWLLEREDEPDTILVPGGLLTFGASGVEHVISRRDAHPDQVLVTVVTTAGTFPAEGAKRYAASTLIRDVLVDAARRLRLTGTEDWVVTVAGRDLGLAGTLAQAGLTGEVALEWGPREGGGGA